MSSGQQFYVFHGLVPVTPSPEFYRNQMLEQFSGEVNKWSILTNYYETERNYQPNRNFMESQRFISFQLRSECIDLLIKLTEKFQLGTEILYLAVSYLDRYLTLRNVTKYNLKLLALTSLYIASKFEQNNIHLCYFVNLTDHNYSKFQFKKMEKTVLKILDYHLNIATNYAFLSSYAALSTEKYQCNEGVEMLSYFISELTLLERNDFVQYLPSAIASGALALARVHFGLPIWSMELQHITRYTIISLQELISKLCSLHLRSSSSKFRIVYLKYELMRNLCVAKIVPLRITFLKF